MVLHPEDGNINIHHLENLKSCASNGFHAARSAHLLLFYHSFSSLALLLLPHQNIIFLQPTDKHPLILLIYLTIIKYYFCK
jgi:hypothetical protein